MEHYAGGGDEGTRERWAEVYIGPAKMHKEFCAKHSMRKGFKIEDMQKPLQIEKDERFRVASSLMSIYHGERRKERFIELFKRAFKGMPKLDKITSWDQCFDGKLSLFLETSLPASKSYQQWLCGKEERMIIPYIRDAAWQKVKLEGPTHVDALLINEDNGFAAQIEGKLLSDLDPKVTYDVLRNQFARNIDVMLEWNLDRAVPLSKRNPNRTVFLLITPEVIKQNPHSRFYGYKYEEYTTRPESINVDLQHRQGLSWGDIASRIGWATWEDFQKLKG